MSNDTNSNEHHDFFMRFCSFWAAPTGARVAEIIAPGATITFTGAGTFSGEAYIDIMQGMLDSFENLNVTPLDYAGNGDRLYIHWKSSAVIEGKPVTWLGVDRFRLANGMAVEEHIIFDSAALQPTGQPQDQQP
jgi:SnoaL-like domain